MTRTTLRFWAAICLLGSLASTAFSQRASSRAELSEPVHGTLDQISAFQVVRLRQNPSASTRFGLDPTQLAEVFPEVIVHTPAGDSIDHVQLAYLLIATVNELRESNAHLGELLEHVMTDKTELERDIHTLEAQMKEVLTKVANLDAARHAREARQVARQ